MSYDFDLFVIGGGSGGVRCARISAGLGARVGIAEARFWGGTCVNVGCVPKKLMVQAADFGGAAADACGFGWHASQSEHRWGVMIEAIHRQVGIISGVYRSMLEDVKATVFDAHARFVDAHTLDVGGQIVTAERIVIATGGQAMRPEFPGSELGVTSDAVFELTEMPKRVAIVGAGYIGVEFAGIFAGLGAQVDLIYRQPHPLRGFDAEIRLALAEVLAAEGVNLHPDSTIVSLRKTEGGLFAMLNETEGLETDFVLYATGRKPLVEGLGLEKAGVVLDGLGRVRVDHTLATSVANIYAIGDAVDRLNLTPVALAHGHILADKFFGEGKRDWNFSEVPTAVFSRPPIATVGCSEQDAAERGPVDVYVAHFTPLKHKLTGRTHHKTCMKLVVDHDSQRVLGAHMMGDDAPEIIQGLAVAITAGATKRHVDQTLGIHPTSAEEFVTLRTLTRVAGVAQAAE